MTTGYRLQKMDWNLAGSQFSEMARFPQGGDFIACGQKFHGYGVTVVQLDEFAEDVGVVDFAGAGLVAAGNVGNVDEADDVDVLLKFFNEIAFGDLLVEEIVEKLHVGMVHFADDLDGFCG